MPLRSLFLMSLLLGLAGCAANVTESPTDGGLPGGNDGSGTLPGPGDGGGADSGTGTGGDAGTDSDAGDGGTDEPVADAGSDGGMNPIPTGNPFVFTGGSNGSILTYRVDASTGGLNFTSSLGGFQGPSFLAHHPGSRFLYAVLEGSSQVAAFSIDLTNGALTEIGTRRSSQGSGPAHLSIDRSGKWLLVSNYGSGHVGVLPIQSDGTLGIATDTKSAGANAHQILTDAANGFVFVPCLGANYVAQYSFDAVQGTLTANGTPTVPSTAGAGPRHLAFHPTGPYAYVINELNDTMTAYNYVASTGRLTAIQSLGTLPGGAQGSATNSTAEVMVHPSGKFVFGSNRSTNSNGSIVVYSVNAGNGQLTQLSNVDTGGTTPRSFALNPEGTRLYVANRSQSNPSNGNVYVLDIDGTSGALTSGRKVADVTGPDFVGYFILPLP